MRDAGEDFNSIKWSFSPGAKRCRGFNQFWHICEGSAIVRESSQKHRLRKNGCESVVGLSLTPADARAERADKRSAAWEHWQTQAEHRWPLTSRDAWCTAKGFQPHWTWIRLPHIKVSSDHKHSHMILLPSSSTLSYGIATVCQMFSL